MTIDQLFDVFDRIISKKLEKKILTQKTYMEYNSISSRLQKHLTGLGFYIINDELTDEIDLWQNANKNEACVNVVKHQLQTIIFSTSL